MTKGKDESKKERIAYAKLLVSAAGSMIGNEEYTVENHMRVLEWSNKFASGKLPVDFSPRTLGCSVKSFGYGSNARLHKSEIEKQATSCYNDDDDFEGLTLAHFYYRRFLKHIYGTLARDGCSQGEACEERAGDETKGAQDEERGSGKAPEFRCDKDLEKEKEDFNISFFRIFQNTEVGVVAATTGEGLTPREASISLLEPVINQSIRSVVGDAGMVPTWCSSYALFGSGDPTTRRSPNRSDEVQEEGKKQPRCDGLLTMPDPMNQESLRALVMMEAKQRNFDMDDDLQSISNACDAISRQPKGVIPWPLLLFRWVLTKRSCGVEVFSMVPIETNKFKVVSLWREDEDTDSLCRSVMAAVYAAIDFREELRRQESQLLFCQVLRNVAVQSRLRHDKEEPDCVYKSFFNTRHREVNLSLVKKHVDPDAEEIRVSDEFVWLKTKYVAQILPKNLECAVERFIEVANTLGQTHGDDYCHGDVRLDNMILGGQRGTLIDWDLAGKEDVRKYPNGLQPIVDGQRHPAVLDAITNGAIGTLQLSKEHDWFSLRAVMRLFSPKDSSNKFTWEGLINNIENEEERNAARQSFSVVLDEQRLKKRKKDGLDGITATGSPVAAR